MRVIVLTQGQHTVVSDPVYEWASRFKWRASQGREGEFYAARTRRVSDGRRRHSYLHREILNAPPGVLVDHIDGDGLNNLDENIRLCDTRENGRNRGKQKNNTSGFRGVCFHKRDQGWAVNIRGPAGNVWDGYFDTATEAARAYDVLAIKLHGEFACLNFPIAPP